jgi:hypothetical protein
LKVLLKIHFKAFYGLKISKGALFIKATKQKKKEFLWKCFFKVLRNKSRLTPEFKGSCSRVKISSEKTIFLCAHLDQSLAKKIFKCHLKKITVILAIVGVSIV